MTEQTFPEMILPRDIRLTISTCVRTSNTYSEAKTALKNIFKESFTVYSNFIRAEWFKQHKFKAEQFFMYFDQYGKDENLKLVQFLINTCDKSEVIKTFCFVCEIGYPDIAKNIIKLIITNRADINPRECIEESFHNVCKAGFIYYDSSEKLIDLAKEKHIEIDVGKYIEEAICYDCEKGYCSCAEDLINFAERVNVKIDVIKPIEEAIYNACMNWLYIHSKDFIDLAKTKHIEIDLDRCIGEILRNRLQSNDSVRVRELTNFIETEHIDIDLSKYIEELD